MTERSEFALNGARMVFFPTGALNIPSSVYFPINDPIMRERERARGRSSLAKTKRFMYVFVINTIHTFKDPHSCVFTESVSEREVEFACGAEKLRKCHWA